MVALFRTEVARGFQIRHYNAELNNFFSMVTVALCGGLTARGKILELLQSYTFVTQELLAVDTHCLQLAPYWLQAVQLVGSGCFVQVTKCESSLKFSPQ